MKAVIMAGGEGTRLLPINAHRPKPMVNLFDRPILEHVLLLLRKNGITEVCMTVRHMAEQITEHFGSGDGLGMHIEYRHEERALGTAGSVKNCAGFIGKDDFLVISGDCVCDFDLCPLINFRKRKNCCAALALYPCRDPLEYGSVVLDSSGRILRFCEKPAWENVVTDLVNTGIYCLSPFVLDYIPDGVPFDFGKDLFPLLLREGRELFGLPMDGYWCDAGSPEAFLRCCTDALEGKIALAHGAAILSAVPDGAVTVPPVYIGRNVRIDPGARIGPSAVLGEGCVIGAGTVITESVLDGVSVGKNARIEGAVICRGAKVGEDASLGRGTVLGEGEQIAPHNGKNGHHAPADKLRFSGGGRLSGSVKTVLSPEVCARLGARASVFGCVGVSGGEGAETLLRAFASGICFGGGDAILLDAPFPAAAAFAGTKFALPVTAHFEQSGEYADVRFFAPGGLPVSRETERVLEGSGEAPARPRGNAEQIRGIVQAYCREAVKNVPYCFGNISAAGPGAENEALGRALALLGCAVTESPGALSFSVINGGFSLTAVQDGRRFDAETMYLLAVLCELARGTAVLSVPFSAPAAVETLAARYGASVLRLGRDGKRAEQVFSSLPALYDGVFAACLIASHLFVHGETLASLSEKLPGFSAVTEKIPVACGRASALRKLTADLSAEFAAELGAGLRVDTGSGCVTVRASHEHDTLLLRAEGRDPGAVQKLCTDFERRIKGIAGK